MFISFIFLTILVLTVASVLVLQFESKAPNANITTGGDSLWYSIVTITTVGYGDFYPVTTAGRVTAMFIMFAGVGIIGALASILASLLVGDLLLKRRRPRLMGGCDGCRPRPLCPGGTQGPQGGAGCHADRNPEKMGAGRPLLIMIDPQAKPALYIKLLALVVVLGMISALVTFAFMALVQQGTHLIGNKPLRRWGWTLASSPFWYAPSAACWWGSCSSSSAITAQSLARSCSNSARPDALTIATLPGS